MLNRAATFPGSTTIYRVRYAVAGPRPTFQRADGTYPTELHQLKQLIQQVMTTHGKFLVVNK